MSVRDDGAHGWKAYVFAATRIGMAWVFLWPFLDKAFGLGYTTSRDNAWFRGGSPTRGFLMFGSDPAGPLHGLFQAMAGHVVVDALFMIGLLGIGLALALGIGMRVATAAGVFLLVAMWVAIMPMQAGTDHNPFWDDHLMYALTILLLYVVDAGRYYGLAGSWRAKPLVQKYPWLE